VNRATSHKSDPHATPIVKAMRWPFPIIWIVPVLAAGLAGYFIWDRYVDRGPLLTLTFNDATGLKPAQSQAIHRGVKFGEVEDCQLSADKKQVLVRVRLMRSQDSYARQGATFWIVRPQISTQEISGLGTILSGPYIDGMPGNGEKQTEFTGLENVPVAPEDGLRILLKAQKVDHLQPDSPVYFRGIQVGVIEEIQLSSDAASVDVHVFIRQRYSPLVRTNSEFWPISGVDVKGGIFTGIQMKVESLRALISGGIGFATPEKNIGEQAQSGSQFVLNDEAKKEWLDWAPKIAIQPDEGSNADQNGAKTAQAAQALGSTVGSK
jgi:paraquat-inducible protein B